MKGKNLMSKLPSDATLDIINKLAGGGWSGTVRISVDAEWYEGQGRGCSDSTDTFVVGKDGPLLSEAYLKSSQQYAADPAPEQADPDNSDVDPMAVLMDAFKKIRFDDYHDIDFSDVQKEELLVRVRGGFGGYG